VPPKNWNWNFQIGIPNWTDLGFQIQINPKNWNHTAMKLYNTRCDYVISMDMIDTHILKGYIVSYTVKIALSFPYNLKWND
jgi:hypothetical protein